MGVGKTVANIDGSRTYEASNTLYKYNLLAEALATEEAMKYLLDYRYMKIISVTVSVLPIITASNNKRYFKFDWLEPEASYGPTDIERDDNAKVVYGNETKNIILKYTPPNANMAGSYGISYNLKNWILTVDAINTPLNYAGYLSVLNTSQVATINWNIKIRFKGAVITQTTAKIIRMMDKLGLSDIQKVKMKLQEKEKEITKGKIEEEEEEEKEEIIKENEDRKEGENKKKIKKKKIE